MAKKQIHRKPCPVCGNTIERLHKSRLDAVKTCSYKCGGLLKNEGKSVVQRIYEKVKVNPGNGCHEFTAQKNASGYGVISIDGKQGLAHRVSWVAHNGAIPCGLHVLHKCDNPKCVNPEHLFLGTNRDNVDDKIAKGRLPRADGEYNNRSKLNSFQVKVIRRMLGFESMTYKEISSIFGVSIQNIYQIKIGRSWSTI